MDKDVEEIKEEKVEKKEKKKKSKEVEELQVLVKEKDDKILRLSAELQNVRRRADEEKQRLLKYEGEEFILQILPVLDNFEHAISMDDDNLEDEVSKFLSGFKMIYNNMVEALKRLDVVEINCLHEVFDENTMNAVLVDANPEFDHNIVLDVMQKGYLYKDKVIRPAMVKVNSKE